MQSPPMLHEIKLQHTIKHMLQPLTGTRADIRCCAWSNTLIAGNELPDTATAAIGRFESRADARVIHHV